ncbi:hypothetical protein HBH70_112040 [Parastagonospora nodorum]|nr:hypothetical protein HBI03_101830 [Parastagonospora nodorum]KAH4274954.1 hypothetical protein HBI04_127640 [Parastagonospora nodorum]KAH4294369.1 hypothetical protein HBI01_166480 [Parastagonospora nodorum]KAH4297189.1 hypothetical protein HBI02_163120 [Parastagonospora nodorum]KAH4325736.1 hypothetical protein HBI00_153170 [Parastagonospora nodorum]
MTLNEEESSRMLGWPYTQSPWDGSELGKWGYSRDTQDEERNECTCNFARYGMRPAFRDLNIDMRPVEHGGPNHCFSVQHQAGPSIKKLPDGTWPEMKDQWYEVNGVWYRETGGFARIGINVVSGIIYFLARSSPEVAAEAYWDVDEVPSDALPKLRSSSDLTWASWNQIAGGTNNLQNIKYFIAMQITNDETLEIVPRALKAMGVSDGQAKLWPGTGFTVGAENETEKEAADALIGCPNGLAAGYFLLQHKRQLGGAKYIWKVVVFKSDPGELQLLFYVDADAHPEKRRADKAGAVRSTAVGKGASRTSYVREHIFRARL